MKVKCINNDNGFENFITVGNIYTVIHVDIQTSSYIITHDKGKGMLPINCFEILTEVL